MKHFFLSFKLLLLCCFFSQSGLAQCLQIDADNLPTFELPAEVCSGATESICLTVLSGDAADVVPDFTIDNPNVTVSVSISSPSNTEICIDVIPTNQTCDPQVAIITINNVTCASGATVEGCILAGAVCLDVADLGFFPIALDPITVYPSVYVETITNPDCDGGNGAAVLVSEDGTECENIEGVAGTANACPLTDDVDATLSYNFTSYNSICYADATAGIEPVDCAVACVPCPNLVNITANPNPVCVADGVLVTICVEFDAAADAIDVNGFMVANAGDTQICYEIEPINATCDIVDQAESPEITCTTDGSAIAILAPVVFQVYPDPALFFEYVVVPPTTTCGEAPTIDVSASTCPPTVASNIIAAVDQTTCDAPGTNGSYTYEIIPNYPAGSTCLPPFEPIVEVVEIAYCPLDGCCVCPDVFDPVCDENGNTYNNACEAECAGVFVYVPGACTDSCPNYVIDPASPVCGEGLSEICINFESAADSYTIFTNAGAYTVANAGDVIICAEVVIGEANQGCDLTTALVNVDLACSDFVVAELINVDVYPEAFTLEVIQPACDGEAGSATLLNALGETCVGPIDGIAGVTGACPGPGTPATLSYDFGTLFEGTSCQQGPFAEDISTPCNPTGCNGCGAQAPIVAVTGGGCDVNNNPIPFTYSEDGTGNTTPPFFTEFIVTDGAGGNIVGVYATLAEAETEALTLGTACIQAINHEGLTNLVNDLDAQVLGGGVLCGVIDCPVNDLAALYAFIGGAGTPLTVTDVEALVGPSGVGNPGFDIGSLIGFPGLIVDVPPFCYDTSAEACITPIACNNPLCEIESIVAEQVVCNNDGTYSVTITVIGTDASVSLDDGTGAIPAVTTAFTFTNGTPYFIEVLDTDLGPVDEPNCNFGPFEGEAPSCEAPTTCTAQAPVVDNDGGDCAADNTDADNSGDGTPFVFTEDGTGNATVPYFNEFIVTDAGGNIIGVFSNIVDATTAANNETILNGSACVQAINHEGLTNVVDELNTAAGGLLCTFIGCPVNDLETLYGAISAFGGPLTVADIVALVGTSGTGNTGVDLGALFGIPFPLVVDVPPFCYDISQESCITNTPCGEEPIITITCEDVPEIALLNDFCVCEEPKIDTVELITMPIPTSVVEFFITNPQLGNVIIDIDSLGIYNASGFAVGEQICVTPIVYDQQDIDDFVTDINDIVDLAAGFGIPLPIPTIPTGTAFSDVFDLVAPILFGGGVLDVAGFDVAIGAVNGTVIDVGELLGLPIPGLLTIEFDICYTIGEEQCATVIDDIAIVMDCPADFEYACDVLPFTLAPEGTGGYPITSGGCGDVTVTYEDVVLAAPTCPAIGGFTRIFTGTDGCGNIETCEQLVIAIDTIAPVIDIAGLELTIDLACSDPLFPPTTLTAIDACDPAATVTVDIFATNNPLCVGNTVTYTFTAEDICGNVSEPVVQTINILPDTTAPTFDAQPTTITDLACGDALPVQEILTATDDCGTATVIMEEETGAGDACSGYTVTHRWIAEDVCFNTDTVEIVFNVLPDTTAPTFDAQPKAIADITCGDALPVQEILTATDDCGTATVIMEEETGAGDACSGYTVTHRWIAEDVCFNTDTVEIVFNILPDGAAPEFVEALPANEILSCGDTVPDAVILTATDDCILDLEVMFTEVDDASDCPASRTITRTWAAADDCGNEISHVQVITIEGDSEAPVFTAPESIELACDDIVPTLETLIATDACSLDIEVPVTETIEGEECSGITITRSYGPVADACGNEAEAQIQIITIAECDCTADETGTDETGTDETGTDETGTDETGTDETGTDETGTDETGTDETGTDETGTDETGTDETGTDETGTDETGTDETGTDETGTDETGTDETGTDETGTDETGTDETGTDETGTDETGTDETGTDETGTDETGTDETGTDETGTDETGTDETGTDETGTDETGTDETGTDETGTDGTGSDLGSISNLVWYDVNGDGNLDAGEGGIGGVEVILLLPDGTIEVTYTDINGNYMFNELPAGDYEVVIGSIPGFEATTPSNIAYSLGEGEDYIEADFGFDLVEEPFNCSEFLVDVKTECGDEDYTVIFSITGFDASEGYLINDALYFDETVILGPFASGTGYSYLVSPANDLECTNGFNAEEVDCSVTAIEMLSFRGEALENGNLLSFTTATETNNDYFTVQRSLNGEQFETIGMVNGTGNTNTPTAYTFIDEDAPNGAAFYRLLDTDYDGVTNIATSVITLTRNANVIVSVYPTPASNVLNIDFGTANQADLSIQIFNTVGKLITVQNVETGSNGVYTLNIESYATGAYFIQINNGNAAQTLKFIKH